MRSLSTAPGAGVRSVPWGGGLGQGGLQDLPGPFSEQADGGQLGDDLGLVTRPGGDRQLTYNGLPLYTFTEEGPGQIDGDGFVDDFDGTHFEWAAATTGAASGSAGSDAPSDNPYRS